MISKWVDNPRTPFVLWVLVLVVLALMMLGGCSLVLPKAGPALSKGVAQYCSTISQDERALIRSEVNAAIAPNAVAVTCATDSQAVQ